MAIIRLAFVLFISFGISANADAACSGVFDVLCHLGITNPASDETQDKKPIWDKIQNKQIILEKADRDSGFIFHKSAGSTGASASPLLPVRAYLRTKEIPPAGVGAYGLVVFQSKATSANRSKLIMVCNSFVAFFPRNETATVPVQDRMVTIWPIDNPDAPQVGADDCNYAVDNYDLNASEAAMGDAQLQHAKFEGEGPYLVGWSPSNARGVADKLVLLVDMSSDNSQELIDQKFLFWKNKIVQDPSLWRSGFSVEGIRAAIHAFADQYGPAMLDAIKLVGDKKS